jgi:aminoglycoside N3'-acetyltransferase
MNLKDKILLRTPPFIEFMMRGMQVMAKRFLPRCSKVIIKTNLQEPTPHKLRADSLAKVLAEMNILPGDILMVHSSLKAIEKWGWSAAEMIDFLLEYLGTSGTLAMPTHPKLSYDEGRYIYNVRRSPSTVGLLTELFRRRKNSIRSHFPFSSAAAQGKRAEELILPHKKSYAPHDENSPYAKLADFGGKVLGLDVRLDRMTILHVAEDVMRDILPINNFYELKKVWVEADGEQQCMEVHRRAEWLWWYIAKFRWMYQMYEANFVHEQEICNVTLHAVDARKVVSWMKDEIAKGRTIYPLAGMNRWLKLKGPHAILSWGAGNDE